MTPFERPMRSFMWLVVLVGMAGCSGESGGDARPESGRPVIGVSVLTLTHPFFQDLVQALREEAAANDYDVAITSCEFDVARQRNQVSDFLVRNVAAIILAPCDSRAIGTSIREANQAGIPVFTADIASLAENATVVSHVATDNYEGGRRAAEAVLEAIDRNGRVAIIDHPEVESVIMRTRGFRDAIDEANGSGANITIVAQLPGGGVKDRAFRVAEDILQAHADLDAIFAINDETALGAVAAIEKAGRRDRVQVVGFDGTLEARRNIRDGKIYADVIQHPKEIGRSVVRLVVEYLVGDRVEPQVLIPATLYRAEDAKHDPLLAPTS